MSQDFLTNFVKILLLALWNRLQYSTAYKMLGFYCQESMTICLSQRKRGLPVRLAVHTECELSSPFQVNGYSMRTMQ